MPPFYQSQISETSDSLEIDFLFHTLSLKSGYKLSYMYARSRVSEIYIKFPHDFLFYYPNISKSSVLSKAQKIHSESIC